MEETRGFEEQPVAVDAEAGQVVAEDQVVTYEHDPYERELAASSIGHVLAATEASISGIGLRGIAATGIAGLGIVSRLVRGIGPQTGCTSDDVGYGL